MFGESELEEISCEGSEERLQDGEVVMGNSNQCPEHMKTSNLKKREEKARGER